MATINTNRTMLTAYYSQREEKICECYDNGDTEYRKMVRWDEMGRSITSLSDIQQSVSEKFECLDPSCYTLEVDELTEIAADELRSLLKAHGFVYGDCLQEVHEQLLFDFISEYETEK